MLLRDLLVINVPFISIHYIGRNMEIMPCKQQLARCTTCSELIEIPRVALSNTNSIKRWRCYAFDLNFPVFVGNGTAPGKYSCPKWHCSSFSKW